jgi:hypothetical protein
MTRPGRPPDDGGCWQSVTSTPASSRTSVEAPPGTTDTASVADRPGRCPDLTLPWDQVPPERRTIGDSTSRLEDRNGVLGVALAQWAARDDTRPQPAIRQAANTAMDAVDAMLAELHQLRARLVGEIRVSDDLAAARADELLARLLARLREPTP